MNRYISFFLALMIMLLTACQSNDPQVIEQQALHDKLMVVHDEVMPKMGDMHKLRKKLVRISENTNLPEGDLAAVKEAIVYLKNADDGMMDWMGAYNLPSKLRGQKTHAEIMEYLQTEKTKIEQVKYDMLTSISAATQLVEKFGGGE